MLIIIIIIKCLTKLRQRFGNDGLQNRLLKKIKILYILDQLVQISPACGPNTHQIMFQESLNLKVSAFATVAGKSFYGKLIAKVDFSIEHYCHYY